MNNLFNAWMEWVFNKPGFNKKLKKKCMLNRWLFYCACAMLFCLCFSPEQVSAGNNVYVFYTGAQSPLDDILELRLKEAFRRIGEKSRLVSTGSAQRALLMANEQGDGDAMRVSEIKKIAPDLTNNLLQIPEPIFEILFYVYTKEKNLRVTGWDSLGAYHNGFRVGAKILEKNIPGQTTILPDAIRLFKMLDQGRLDTVTEHDIIGDDVIRELNLSGIIKLNPALITLPGYCFIHKKNQHLIPKLAKALSEMKTDGTFRTTQDQVESGNK